jgi:hypothetical protein
VLAGLALAEQVVQLPGLMHKRHRVVVDHSAPDQQLLMTGLAQLTILAERD